MSQNRVTINDLFPSHYLKAADLPGEGVIVTIVGWQMEDFENNGDKQQKPTLSFAKSSKRLVLNKTQATALAKLANSDAPDDWIGARVRLSPAPLANGKQTIIITAAPAPKVAAPAPPPIFDDSEGLESEAEEVDF